jgi:hypothetical protein
LKKVEKKMNFGNQLPKSRGKCISCKKKEPDGYYVPPNFLRCDKCRELICERSDCSKNVRAIKSEQGYVLGFENQICKTFDKYRHPETIFCGKGCGCMDKPELFLCIKCSKK